MSSDFAEGTVGELMGGGKSGEHAKKGGQKMDAGIGHAAQENLPAFKRSESKMSQASREDQRSVISGKNLDEMNERALDELHEKSPSKKEQQKKLTAEEKQQQSRQNALSLQMIDDDGSEDDRMEKGS
jgi:hypothetical protein